MSGVEQPVEPETNADDMKRPKTVGECRGGIRPCPFVSCRFNLLIDVTDNGAIVFSVPRDGVVPARIARSDSESKFEGQADAAVEHWFTSEQPVSSCLIDEVKDPRTLEEISKMLCTTRERVRQIEVVAVEHLVKRVAAQLGAHGIEDVAGEERE